MRTPAGKECPHYHEDFHRGRNIQECRLANQNPESIRWKPTDCKMCQVPEILNANASQYLELKLTIKPKLLGLGRQIEIKASCVKHRIDIEDPYVGCPKCNAERPGLNLFWEALKEDDQE
ncbi:MAG: hypothetical protein ABI970_00795 [Chloroflexota bacterium]|nr:hypothetical protein [Anaerolineae bacterium]